MEKWLAHSAPTGGQPQSLSDHLRTVSQMASSFAASLGFSEEAALAGILHDCGKYGEKFDSLEDWAVKGELCAIPAVADLRHRHPRLTPVTGIGL